jgi:hypothetical protein
LDQSTNWHQVSKPQKWPHIITNMKPKPNSLMPT